MSNYQQPDFRVPINDPRVGVQVENATQPGNTFANALGVTWPIALFIEPGIDTKLDPHGSIRAGRSGK